MAASWDVISRAEQRRKGDSSLLLPDEAPLHSASSILTMKTVLVAYHKLVRTDEVHHRQ
jgi:hypothetical protein